MNLLNKKIGIFGLGLTGTACFRYLQSQASLVCFDESKPAREEFLQNFPSNFLADLSDERWKKLDYIIASPGVPLYHPQIHELAKLADVCRIEIISDVDVLFLHQKGAKFIAVTGTNGKSTTCSLLGHILEEEDFVVGGNIGMPCLSLESKAGYAIELSSYQLDLLKNFKPNIAAITNITPDHLDRYPSMDDYIASKLSIAKNMDTSSYLVVNIDDEVLKTSTSYFANTNLIKISTSSKDCDIFYSEGKIVDSIGEKDYSFVAPKSLQGEHNLYNILTAFAIASKLGIPPEIILQRIASFPGIKHRIEFVGARGAISFYNDSKATNAAASAHALKAMDNIFWLAGGVPKAGGVNSMAGLMGSVKRAYFFGQSRFEMAKQVSVDHFICDTMEQALEQSFIDAKKFGQTCNILLSPACASFDQFKNFEARGELFTQLVRNLI